MSKRIHIIFNPISGQGDAGRELESLEAALETVGDMTVHLTSAERSGKALAEQALEAGADIVVAAGGDGTVSAIASALIGTETPMGIIPRGTVNAFASALEIPSSVVDACDVIIQQNSRKVDTARCGDHTMLLLASLGFEAKMMQKIDRDMKNRYGRLAIVIGGLQQWVNLDQFHVEVNIDNQVQTFDATAVTVANAATVETILAQGPAQVDLYDGMLDITILDTKSRLGALVSAADLLMSGISQREASHEGVTHIKTPALTLAADPVQSVLLDGELIGQTPMEIHCLKRSLNVLVPLQL